MRLLSGLLWHLSILLCPRGAGEWVVFRCAVSGMNPGSRL